MHVSKRLHEATLNDLLMNTNTLANAFSTHPKGTELVTHLPVRLPEM
jgi:hypothetical protein